MDVHEDETLRVQARLEVLDALMKVFTRPHEVVDVFLHARDSDEATVQIGLLLNVSAMGATAVADLQLSRLSQSLRERLLDEHKTLRQLNASPDSAS